MTTTSNIPAALAPFLNIIATAARTQPAATIRELADQLTTAHHNLTDAGLDGAVSLADAAQLLLDADDATTDNEQHAAYVAEAAEHLADTTDLVDQYRNQA
ncbi:hypothetical protein [Streptomyces sp. NPDC008150]|uniref:hypothetical protein n=1 Tax=Streptomyces sp. NPDC008150 TaxID=3364816 RepID=UPI0036E3B1F1